MSINEILLIILLLFFIIINVFLVFFYFLGFHFFIIKIWIIIFILMHFISFISFLIQFHFIYFTLNSLLYSLRIFSYTTNDVICTPLWIFNDMIPSSIPHYWIITTDPIPSVLFYMVLSHSLFPSIPLSHFALFYFIHHYAFVSILKSFQFPSFLYMSKKYIRNKLPLMTTKNDYNKTLNIDFEYQILFKI